MLVDDDRATTAQAALQGGSPPGAAGSEAIEAALQRAQGAPRLATVVLALGGAAADAGALRWTAHLAGGAGARVVVVHAVPTLEGLLHDMPPFGMGNWRIALRDEITSRWCRPLIDAGVAHRVVVREEGAGHAVLGVATAEGADLIVLGSRSGRGMGGGSLASHLVHRASCPVLVVPPAT